MKSITIAAGLGSRLGNLTTFLPKCMIKVKNKSILSYQLDAFRQNHVNENIIITGHLSHKIKMSGCEYIKNKNFKTNNILHSLFCAKIFFDDELLISYSDIIFSPVIISSLINSKFDITLVLDKKWKTNYINRKLHPISEAEKAIINKNYIIDIGKNIKSDHLSYEFIGLMKLSYNGSQLFKKFFDIAYKEFKNKPFFEAISFEKAYLTDFIKFLIINKININFIEINNFWIEIDTQEDLIRAENQLIFEN